MAPEGVAEESMKWVENHKVSGSVSAAKYYSICPNLGVQSYIVPVLVGIGGPLTPQCKKNGPS